MFVVVRRCPPPKKKREKMKIEQKSINNQRKINKFKEKRRKNDNNQ